MDAVTFISSVVASVTAGGLAGAAIVCVLSGRTG
jgi:hypothetical protein